MAEFWTLLRLLAPALLVALADGTRGRGVARASLLAGLGVSLPACADLLHRVLGGAATGAASGLLPRAWAAEAVAAALALALPTLVRLAWETRARARVALLSRERAQLVAQWHEEA